MATPGEVQRAYNAEVNDYEPVILHDNEEYGLGRLWIPDMRDSRYSIERVIPPYTTRTYKYWPAWKFLLDQNGWPQCVEYSWHHFLLDSPTTHKQTLWEFGTIYKECQLVDEWPGEDYDGTSVRAGAKVLQARGLIRNYYWAQDISAIKRAILENGPVVVGTAWYSGMMQTSKTNRVHCTGSIVGGHAYVLNGVNLQRNTFRIKNSWRNWGIAQHATIDIDEWNEKCFSQWGEACIAIEQ